MKADAVDPLDYAEARRKTSRIVDKLSCPIDPGILDTVTILRLHGINTIGSCEGHIGRITGGPYIMFEAPKTDEYRLKYRTIGDRKDPEYAHWYKKATKENMHEIQKMLILLEKFYMNRQVSNNLHLIVRCFDSSVGELMCQGADIAHILDERSERDLLAKNQQEMQAFTNYLMQEYYKDKKVKAPRAA